MSGSAPKLRPREHGAYAMLAFPVASGLVVGGASVAGCTFAVLAVSGFLAHEAALVVLGRRGERIRSAADAAARARLGLLAGVALASAVAFALTAPRGALAWALPPALLGASVMALVLAGGTKTLPGELLVAVAFASVHAPVAAAGATGRSTPVAVVAPAVVWAASFGLATLSVHALKARFRAKGAGERSPGTAAGGTVLVGAAPASAAALLALAVAGLVAGHPLAAAACALIPKAVLVLAVAALDVHPRHLKRVGWSLVAADTATLVVLASAL